MSNDNIHAGDFGKQRNRAAACTPESIGPNNPGLMPQKCAANKLQGRPHILLHRALEESCPEDYRRSTPGETNVQPKFFHAALIPQSKSFQPSAKFPLSSSIKREVEMKPHLVGLERYGLSECRLKRPSNCMDGIQGDARGSYDALSEIRLQNSMSAIEIRILRRAIGLPNTV